MLCLRIQHFLPTGLEQNDVLSYATNGGAQSDGVTPANDHNVTGNTNPATYGGNDITNSKCVCKCLFNNYYNINIKWCKGVVCTIPSVTSIPYFTTVPYAPVSDAALNANPQASIISSIISVLAVATNGRIAPLNLTDGVSNPVLINDADLTDLSAQITFYANNSGNPLLIVDASTLGALYGKARQTTSADLIVLPASSVIGTTSGNPAPFNIQGVTQPLANRWVLTAMKKQSS